VNGYDEESTAVLDALRDGFGEIRMSAPVEQIVDAGQARRRRRRLAKVTAAATIAAVVAVSASSYDRATPDRATSSAATGTATKPVHIRTVAFVVDTKPDGTVTVTWTKHAYFKDSVGLQDALRKAGFPVLIKVGEFCKGPDDDGNLDPSGEGRGVDQVVRPSESNGDVVLTFVPSAMPPATELFIGYLSPAQLAITHGAPGSVERLVPTQTPLTCTTEAPPSHYGQAPTVTADSSPTA
jgi:hypothetical protein